MPVNYLKGVNTVIDPLYSYFAHATEALLPFDIKTTHHDLIRGWLASIHSDEAVCTAFVAHCAWFYSERTTQQSKLTSLGLKNEARSLALLRHRIETDAVITDGTLLAAALQFFIATLSTKCPSQLSRIAQGISALVAAKGGPRVTACSVSPSTRQSLIFADVFNSLLHAQKPFLESADFPAKPSSYDSLYTASVIDAEVAGCLDPELIEVLETLNFVLFFRTPSQQSRKLFSEESHYLFMTLQKISYMLCIQQSRLVRSHTLSEIAAYGMILVKEQVLLDVTQHPILPITILRRLRDAVTSKMNLQGPGLTVSLWASTMALMGTEFESERSWALKFITATLTGRYGSSWPESWILDTRRELQRVLWHQRIEEGYGIICTKLQSHLCSNTT